MLTRPLHTGFQEWAQVLCAKMRLVGPYHPAPATETTVVIKIFQESIFPPAEYFDDKGIDGGLWLTGARMAKAEALAF
ncbi:hypothetical protein SCP_0600170 [Sparassis crispa]|uniref:Uncharacterized protein n=1 Tax=Sparassis crispa TaxID=139825 RepID=A0A401GPE7_9APHY|nr:hypothetical protein SCP_0600170 [Sparassis crispa]GBE84040.1 hypothetical protein SCP_0600170 [Sparassis crispa]